MLDVFHRRMDALAAQGAAHLLVGGLVGLEKECLRVAPDGTLSQRAHPASLGSPLTHPWITTDYSEALLELITPPFASSADALGFLEDLQTYVYRHLDGETLWGTSMPCVVAGESGIPIARYGNSNAGMMKHVYRVGLGYRYGRVMQVIAGTHFNYSVPEALWPVLQAIDGDAGEARDYRDSAYMGMMRNLQRFGWLVPYLFGASPAVCKSFFGGRATDLPVFDESTHFAPYATSLRMSDIGYQNQKEEHVGVKACYDSLDGYIRTLSHAIDTPAPLWETIGVKVDGEWRQLNANILQIENEYYSTIRPKQLLEGLEKPVLALRRRGIRYVELRSPDINAFHPLGIDEQQLAFLEALMLFSALCASPRIDLDEARQIDHNLQRTAFQGRLPGLRLLDGGKEVPLRVWAQDILAAMAPLCVVLDETTGGTRYCEALAEQRDKVEDPALTPSARMLADMRNSGEGFHDFAWRQSREHQAYFAARALADRQVEDWDREARESIERQSRLEAADSQSFDAFLETYFNQD